MDKLYEALAVLKQAGMTLIIIEQDVGRALALADHAYVLEHGVFGPSGTPGKIAADPRLRHARPSHGRSGDGFRKARR
jgi:branched-chain amino acid transport system ATP-binding protein